MNEKNVYRPKHRDLIVSSCPVEEIGEELWAWECRETRLTTREP